MLRFISSFLVLLLGTTASLSRGARPRAALRARGRQRPDEDGASARAFEATERPRARARQFRRCWPGSVELVRETHTEYVPGTWTLTDTPFHRQAAPVSRWGTPPIPHPTHEPRSWTARMQTLLSLQEPGTRLRVGESTRDGWQTLEVAVPTHPPTIVQVDRTAVAQILNGPVSIRLRINA